MSNKKFPNFSFDFENINIDELSADELKQLQELAAQFNTLEQMDTNHPISVLEDYSLNDMQELLCDLLGPNCPVQLKSAAPEDYENIPMLNQIKHYLTILRNEKEITLTKNGFLPAKYVKDLYSQGFIGDFAIESGVTKRFWEVEIPSIHLTRILAEMSGLSKKRNNKVSLTKKGEKYLAQNNKAVLFSLVFNIFVNEFNWSFFDGYDDEEFAQVGFGYTLILLNKYGDVLRHSDFYADKYLAALFPDPIPENAGYRLKHVYALRTFSRCLDYWGLIDRVGQSVIENGSLKKAPLFNKLITVHPPRKRSDNRQNLLIFNND